jgi:hypothetical protein
LLDWISRLASDLILAKYNNAARVRMNNSSNCRYWIGLAGHQSLAAVNYATDTPNHKTVMFRYSAGTDTHVQAYVATDSSHRTVVDTGVAIKLSTVATISTNTPSASDTYIFVGFYSDNKKSRPAFAMSLLSIGLSLPECDDTACTRRSPFGNQSG